MQRKRGFTLLEILIVLCIMGILITAVAISFVNLRRNARNASRREDLDTYATAMDLWRSTSERKDYLVIINSTTPAGYETEGKSTSTGKFTRRNPAKLNSIADTLQGYGILNKIRTDPLASNKSYTDTTQPDYYLTLCQTNGNSIDLDSPFSNKAVDFAIYAQLESDTSELQKASKYCNFSSIQNDGYNYARGSKLY